MAVTGAHCRISLSAGAQRTKLTSQGLLKILKRTDSAIRDDGRWYVDPAIIDQIATARRVLGIAYTQGSKIKEKAAVRPHLKRSQSSDSAVRKRTAKVRRPTPPEQRNNSEALASSKPEETQRPAPVPPESPA
jgi:hypothetical protein